MMSNSHWENTFDASVILGVHLVGNEQVWPEFCDGGNHDDYIDDAAPDDDDDLPFPWLGGHPHENEMADF